MTTYPVRKNLNTTDLDNVYKGYPTLCKPRPELVEYLETSRLVLEQALQSHPNTLFVKFSLRISRDYVGSYKELILSFFDILASEVRDHVRQHCHFVGDIPESQLGYLWTLNNNFSYGYGFQVYLFVNQQTFYTLNRCSEKVGGLKILLQNSWAMALDTTLQEGQALMVFPLQARDCLLKAGDDKHSIAVRNGVYARMSGNAKSSVKGSRNEQLEFGGSNTT